MENAWTVETVLPGANIVRQRQDDDTPLRFFRSQLFDTLQNGAVASDHETLLGTLRALVGERMGEVSCPVEGCDRKVDIRQNTLTCRCGEARLHETDALRLAERFTDRGSNGEVHGEARHLLEVLVLINILRFFATPDRARYLAECVFVLDGPLAMFGHTAWLTSYVRAELQRINFLVRRTTGSNILVIGYEKSGQFVDHFEQLDWSEESGIRGRIAAGTVLIPDHEYINQNIVLRPPDAKPHGNDTYFGRKIFYKNRSEQHSVFSYGMTAKELENFRETDPSAFPRLGDALDVLDYLATYMYEDGFMPLVRAHAHAAIPLQRGADILDSLFRD
jgi:hypothetical protein